MGNSGPNYRGPLGTTACRQILYRCPSKHEVLVELFDQINAQSDPELADAIVAETNTPTVVDPQTRVDCTVHVRRIFHHPARELFVLVLTDAHRHRELECRAELYQELARTPEFSVPEYVRRFEVVYCGAEISAILAQRLELREAEQTAALLSELRTELDARAKSFEDREAEFSNLEIELRRREAEFARQSEELSRRDSEIHGKSDELSRREGELSRQVAEHARRRTEFARAKSQSEEAEEVVAPEPATESPASPRETQKGMPRVVFSRNKHRRPTIADVVEAKAPKSDSARTSPFSRVDLDEAESETPLEADDVEEIGSDDVVVADQLGGESSVYETDGGDGSTRIGGATDVTLERWIASRDPTLATIDDAGNVRLAAALAERSLEALLGKELKVMLQLHDMPTYPLITLSVGAPAGFSMGRPTPATFHFNVGEVADRGVLEELARDFTFQIDLFDTDYLPVRKRTITAGLAPNAQYVLTASDECLLKVKKRTEPSYTRALLAYDAPNYDRFGRMHPERKEFREDVLVELDKASKVRWALHVCRRFSTAEGLEYLFLTRGYPIRSWQKRRRAVIARAYEIGLWPGSSLVGVAMSEGLAGSRSVFAKTLARNFAEAFAEGADHDLDEDAVRDNWTALAEELRAQGLDPDAYWSPSSEAISSELQDAASGTIGPLSALASVERKPMSSGNPRSLASGTLTGKSTDELVALLSDRDRRYDAALELCRASTPAAVRPLFSALKRMTRAEAGHVFGGVVSFGDAAIPHLIDTLGSRKGFLRQGAALSLAALGAEDGLDPVCELLVSEPTDIWKEVARALGEFGPRAVMPLCTQLRGGSEVAHERIAWALAHIGSRGDRIAIDTLAAGRDPIAAGVARHALELAELARSDNRSIWSPRPGREHTVKRAFSKRVFEALPNGSRKNGDSSAPAMALSEVDLLDASELEDDIELDESDLLPS